MVLREAQKDEVSAGVAVVLAVTIAKLDYPEITARTTKVSGEKVVARLSLREKLGALTLGVAAVSVMEEVVGEISASCVVVGPEKRESKGEVSVAGEISVGVAVSQIGWKER